MKKLSKINPFHFWSVNLLITIGVVMVFLLLQGLFFNTKAEFISNTLWFAIIMAQLIVSIVYVLLSIKWLKFYTVANWITAILSTGCIYLALLFTFNVSYWDTDTGTWRVYDQKIELDKMPESDRANYLIDMGQKLTHIFGPDYYRAYGEPIISDIMIFESDDKRKEIQNNVGRSFYEVAFPYDKTKEILEWEYASKIRVWADNGEPFEITFGNGYGINFFFESWETLAHAIKPVPYQCVDEPEKVLPLSD